MQRTIVVGVDRREGGRDALALAALLRDVCGAQLAAVYVYPFDRTVHLDDADALEGVLQDELLAELEQELARAGVTARPVVVSDALPAHALQSFAERDGADLIVVGAPHRVGADRVLGGDVAAGTLWGAPCAVAVAPAGYAEGEPTLDRVGVGFDGSPESRAALGLGGRLARAAEPRCRSCRWRRRRSPRTRRPRLPRAAATRPSPAGRPRSSPDAARTSTSSWWARAGTGPCAGCCSAAPRHDSCASPAVRCS